MADRLRFVPAWAWLGAIVLASFALRAWLARQMVAPFIMTDELTYSELARSLAAGAGTKVRDLPVSGYGLVYPLLISPAYIVFHSLVDAYGAVKTIGALTMSLAAIPAYFLARRVVRSALALLAAVLAVAVPSMAYSGTVMTENAFYPLVLLIALALVLVLEQPTAWRLAFLVVLIPLSYETRVQSLTIVPALLCGPLVLAVLRGNLRGTLRPFAGLYAGVAAVCVLGLVSLVGTGHSPKTVFGAYRVAGEGSYDAGKALHYLVYHWAELFLYLGYIPVIAFVILLVRSRRLDERLQAYLAGTLSLSFWFVLVASVFASRFADRIQERNIFEVAPFFVIALLAWIERGTERPWPLALPAAAAVAATALLIPFDRFISTSAISDTLMLLPWFSVQDRTGLSSIPAIAFGVAIALSATTLLVPRRYAIILPLIVLAYWAVAFKPIWFGKHGVVQASRGALFQAQRGNRHRDWIDRAVPPGTSVGIVYTGATDRFAVNANEFFNRAVGPIYWTNAPTPGGDGSETRVGIDPVDGRVRTGDGKALPGRWFLLDGTIDPNGTRIARDEEIGITLWRLHGPLVQLNRVRGVYPDGWSGPTVQYLRRHCLGGHVAVSFHGDASLFGNVSTTVVGSVDGRPAASLTFPQTGSHAMRVPLVPRNGRCVVVFSVSPTAVPSEVLPGSDDERELGTHFDSLGLER